MRVWTVQIPGTHICAWNAGPGRTNKHGSYTALRLKTLRGWRSAGHKYSKALLKYFRWHEYVQNDCDSWIFSKCDKDHTVVICITVDDVLVTEITKGLIDELFDVLTRQYSVKRLGWPADLLGWSVTNNDEGGINLTQTKLTQPKIKNEIITAANDRSTPCNTNRNSYHRMMMN